MGCTEKGPVLGTPRPELPEGLGLYVSTTKNSTPPHPIPPLPPPMGCFPG